MLKNCLNKFRINKRILYPINSFLKFNFSENETLKVEKEKNIEPLEEALFNEEINTKEDLVYDQNKKIRYLEACNKAKRIGYEVMNKGENTIKLVNDYKKIIEESIQETGPESELGKRLINLEKGKI